MRRAVPFLVTTVALGLAACGGGDRDEESSAPIRGISSTACSPTTSDGHGTPRHLVVLVGPLQNAIADHGIQNAQAVKLVLAQRGWRAGGDGVALQVCDEASADEYSDVAKCERIAAGASNNPGVVAVLGPSVSSCARRMLPILNRARGGPVAMLGIGNTYLGLTRGGPGVEEGDPERLYPAGGRNYLRIAPADDVQGAASVIAAREAGARRVFAVHDGTTYGRGVGRAFAEAAGRAGLTYTGTASWDPEARGYRALAARIAAAGADAVFLGGYAQNNGGRLLRDLRGALGKGVALYGADGFNFATELAEGAGERAEGLTVTLSAVANSALPRRGREWAAEFTRRYGSRPCCYAVHAAQLTELVLDAIERSDGSRAGVLDKLMHTRTSDGLVGGFSFDEYGDSTLRGVSLHRIEGGRLRYLRTIEVPDGLIARG
jgi:branched-chain amino acid transport system substrate-binding protein